jgi:putative transposase
MPGKNLIKISVDNAYYHIYNRGVEKRTIFEDEQDYKVFINYLSEYLSPKPDPVNLRRGFTLKGSSFQGIPHQPKNYSRTIDLIAYCLMPNHFHLLIKQIKGPAMEGFMRSLATRYSVYFNKKYTRVGHLFQGIYKAAVIESDQYLLYLSKYIHRNPNELGAKLTSAYSSYSKYLGLRQTSWIKPGEILSFFNNAKIGLYKKVNSYRKFVEETDENLSNINVIPESILLDG